MFTQFKFIAMVSNAPRGLQPLQVKNLFYDISSISILTFRYDQYTSMSVFSPGMTFKI